jgi:IS30 family transposase
MPRNYNHLTPQDRAVVMLMRDDQCSIRSIAKRLCRSASTISRELKRADSAGVFDANQVQMKALVQRVKPRKVPKHDVHRRAPPSQLTLVTPANCWQAQIHVVQRPHRNRLAWSIRVMEHQGQI